MASHSTHHRLLAALAVASLVATPARGAVLRVGSWHGKAGDFTTIQDAIDAAQPGDWVLVGPGDYHERGDYKASGPADEAAGGVMIRTPRIHLRGMDRNQVIVDGTLPGSSACDAAAAAQDLGPLNASEQPVGRNGIEAFEVDGVTIENLTVCNFLADYGGGGNGIWWNGGDGTGTINMGSYRGDYISATSTAYLGDGQPAAEYGIFVSNSRGPGTIAFAYASNMADSGFYVGACPDCNTVLTRVHSENSALGYSGTNSGGHLVIDRSEWDENTTGISTNSQNNDDAPSPQSGACPAGARGPHHGGSCTFFRDNFIHDNNNPNVPRSGSAALGPVGTGMVLAGGRYDTVLANRVENQGAWGILVVPFPDFGTPPPIAHCEGGDTTVLPGACYYDSWGQDVTKNRFKNIGFFGNVANGDLADLSAQHDPGNCWHGNTDASHTVSTAPDDLQTTHKKCGIPNAGADLTSPLADQVICATEAFGPCPDMPGHHYPRTTAVTLKPLPTQKSMPNPCKGVPSNPWC